MNCSKQQPKQQNEELPSGQTTSASATTDSYQPSQPGVVYADIAESEKPVSSVPPNSDREANNAPEYIYRDLQSKDLPTGEMSPATSNSVQPSKPGVVYGDIVPVPDAGNPQYENVPQNNDRGPVQYSELLRKDSVDQAKAPVGDLYTQVQKR